MHPVRETEQTKIGQNLRISTPPLQLQKPYSPQSTLTLTNCCQSFAPVAFGVKCFHPMPVLRMLVSLTYCATLSCSVEATSAHAECCGVKAPVSCLSVFSGALRGRAVHYIGQGHHNHPWYGWIRRSREVFSLTQRRCLEVMPNDMPTEERQRPKEHLPSTRGQNVSSRLLKILVQAAPLFPSRP